MTDEIIHEKLDTIIKILAMNLLNNIESRNEKILKLADIGMKPDSIAGMIGVGINSVIQIELEKICTTNQRKMMWVILDREKMSNEIAQIVGRTTRAVDMFLEKAEYYQIAKNPRNEAPYRLFDFIPSGWSELVEQS